MAQLIQLKKEQEQLQYELDAINIPLFMLVTASRKLAENLQKQNEILKEQIENLKRQIK